MLYFYINSADKDSNNQIVKDILDPQGGENTFIENMTDGENNYCLISIPDDGSPYSEGMKENFQWSNDDPRTTPVDAPAVLAVLGKDGKITNQLEINANVGRKITLSDISE